MKKNIIIIDDPLSVLKSLRWSADMKVFSPDEPGILIWLKQSTKKEEKKCGYGFLKHCCYVDDPCNHHKQIQNNIDNANKN